MNVHNRESLETIELGRVTNNDNYKEFYNNFRLFNNKLFERVKVVSWPSGVSHLLFKTLQHEVTEASFKRFIFLEFIFQKYLD